jgi:AGZA family xanthine/uracil permease-like MFS transporter
MRWIGGGIMAQGTGRLSGRSSGTSDGFIERQFRLSQHGTDVRTEIIGGITTFMVMSYIIAVNPAILNLGGGGLGIREVATVTCLAAGLLTIAMGLYANRAIAIAPGLGLNAIVAFTLVGAMGLTFPQAMGVVVAEGIIIFLLVLLGVRQYVMDVVPLPLKQAISVGIGFFILFIGLRNAGVAGTGAAGLPELLPLNTWPIFVSMSGLAITLVLVARGVRGAILWGILASTVIAFIVPGNVAVFPDDPLAGPDFSLIGDFSFGFIGELGFLTALLVVFSLMLADFFDTMGTLVGVGSRAGYLDENGNFIDAQKPLLVDSAAAAVSGAMSASSSTSYIESVAGVEAGGRTGLVSVVTGLLFLLALPFVNLVNAIPSVATAPALIVVGVLMIGVLSQRESGSGASSRQIAFDDIEEGLPVVLTMLVMPFTTNITNGIGAGFVSYVLLKIARGKAGQVNPALYAIAAAFLLYFLRWALFDAEF